MLVRHGETDYNELGRWQGSGSDRSLNAAGLAQAAAVARSLGGNDYSALYTSDLLRCRQTAEPIAGAVGLEMRLEPAIREASHGAWEGRTLAEIMAHWGDAYRAFERDPVGVQRPGGESYGDLAARVWPALERFADSHVDSTIIVVTHGGPVRLVLSRVLGQPLTRRGSWGVDNATRFTVERSGGIWRLVAGNDGQSP